MTLPPARPSIFSVTLAVLAASAASTFAATPLGVGDVTVVGYRSGAPDSFAFVTWVDLTPGTSIGFTDGSYLSGGLWSGGENFATWSTSTLVPAGTVIVASDGGSGNETYDLGTAGSGRMSGISASGDQVFVFQRTDGTVDTTLTPFTTGNSSANFKPNHTLIYGQNLSNSGFITTGAGTTNASYLPDGNSGAGTLDSSSSFSLNFGDAQYTGARSGLTVGEYKTAILNATNWTVLGSGQPSSTDFSIVPEPTTAVNLLCGLSCLLALRRRR